MKKSYEHLADTDGYVNVNVFGEPTPKVSHRVLSERSVKSHYILLAASHSQLHV